MKTEDALKAARGHFDIGRLDRIALRRIWHILKRAHYCEANIFRTLQIQYFSMITLNSLPIFLHFRLVKDTPFNKLVRLFLLSQWLAREDLEKGLFTASDIDDMCAMGILRVQEGLVSSTVDIFPCLDTFIATDHHFTDHISPRAVMYLGKDSYTLARGTLRKKVNRTLDLCTGSGVQALLAARHSCLSRQERKLYFTGMAAARGKRSSIESLKV